MRWISFFCCMKKFLLALSSLLIVWLLTPLGYKGLIAMLLSSGLSWTLSEWSFYGLLLLCGFFVGWSLTHVFQFIARWKRVTLRALVASVPFVIGFAQHPIYEDLLWDLSQDMSKVEATTDYHDADLLVIAIADCHYCKRAVKDMQAMHQRNPNLRMRMVVCTADSSWLEPYRSEAGGAFEVVMATDMDVMATQAGGHFPAYVLVRDGQPSRRWTNNEWGAVAKDIVEGTSD